MSETAKEIAALSAERRQLLELLLKPEMAAGSSLAIPRRKSSTSVPLSFAQQRIWFLNQMDPRGSAYNTPAAVRLSGRLNAAAMERTLSEIVRRHEVLRTTFTMVAGQPGQAIHEAEPMRLPLIDLTGLPEARRELEAQNLAQAEAGKPFDLERGPLVRATLVWLAETEYVLLFTMHHIVSDGWSMGVLIREVATLYEAFAKDRPSPLPELPIQFGDFALWEREWLGGETLKKQLAYWKQQLEGKSPTLELPTDRPRLTAASHKGASKSFVLPENLSASLKALCRCHNVTLFVMLLAAFNALLHLYTGQEDILVGSPIANRNRAETEGLIGCFINTLVMRTDLSGNPSFGELLDRVRETVLGAFANQDVPFERVVAELRPERTRNHQRFFRVWFVLHNAPMQALELPGLRLSNFKIERGTAQFDLAMSVMEAAGQIVGTLNYNTDLFDAETIAEMLERYALLLESVAAHPEARLLDISLTGNENESGPITSPGLIETHEMEDQFVL
jgi:hypothetical protein